MHIIKKQRPLFTSILLFIAILLHSFLVKGAPTLAQESIRDLREIRTIEKDDAGLSNAIGLAHSPEADLFLVVEEPVDGRTTVALMTPYAKVVGRTSLNMVLSENANVTFDARTDQLLIYEPATQRLVKVDVDLEDAASTAAVSSLRVGDLGVSAPGGMVVDPSSGELVFLDSAARQLVRVTVKEGEKVDEGITRTDISRISLKNLEVTDARGLSINPLNGHLYFFSPSQQKAYETTASGKLLVVYELAEFGLVSPEKMVVAPTGDKTDDPATMSLYIINKGQIVELSTAGPLPIPDFAPTEVGILIKKTETSEFSPPSPDPAGITYMPDENALLISDSEVEETPIWAGKNLFKTTLGGELITTYTTFPNFSDEPTDVAYNPDNKHIFISDDTGTRMIYELDPGPDGNYNTADDIVHQFQTAPYGSNDSEGVSFDTDNGYLIFTDGLDGELFILSPGTNGIFDGRAGFGGDDVLVNQFDTTQFGITDPEGSAYNFHNGNIFILGANEWIAEVTAAGELVRMIDIRDLEPVVADRLAGIVYAPASGNANLYHLYVVARGEDEGQNINENDGVLYEISFSSNNPPVVNAGVDQVSPSTTVNLAGTVTDDGMPSPPGAVTTTWSKVSGPGTVTFGNAAAVDTTATFSATGVYILRLSASDGDYTSSDDVKITILSDGPNQAPTVDAGPAAIVTLADEASLNGTATDDGLPFPPSSLTYTWSVVSGPGTVTFADPNAEDTTATFSGVGVYILRLTVSDSELEAFDDVVITVQAAPPETTIVIPVSLPSDDAEQRGTNMDLNSSDLELVEDLRSGMQTVGVRFNGLTIPQGSPIVSAYIQFQVDESTSTPADLTIHGEAADNPVTFSGAANITNRPLTTASVNWVPPAWAGKGTAGPDQRTPDLSSVVQELVDRAGWSSGNSMAFIISGTGTRIAASYDGLPAGAPKLIITYATNQPPTVNAGPDQTINFGEMANLSGTVVDDGRPDPPGAVTSTWSMLSGLGTVTFGDANAVDTTAGFSAPGVYVLRLTGYDGHQSGSDDVIITVLPGDATNLAPVVEAGDNQVVSLAAGATLNGTVTDDGKLNPTPTVSWAKVDGPGTVTFADASAVNTTVTFSEVGIYTLRLTADDGEFVASDDVVIVVTTGNTAPVVNAGDDQTIILPATASLVGTYLDDGLPASPGSVTTTWSMVSGPGTVTFADAHALNTTASFSHFGVYLLRLTADDGELLGTDDVLIIVNPAGNTAPVVDAGSNQTITLPAAASLNGTVTDDGLPVSGTMTTNWTMFAGTGTVTFADASSLNTTATFSAPGVYVLRLVANDGALTGSDLVTITVNPSGNAAPVVDAGDDQTITLPAAASLNGTATDDGLPSGTLTTSWSKISGPGDVTFADANALSTTATFSAAGTYVLRLTASDGVLSDNDEVTITVNSPSNAAPVVDAGSNQTITLPAAATLNGTVTDDGLPSGTLTTSWSKVSGPGTVTFANASAVDTTATFSAPGVYVLQLTANDGSLSASDQVTVTVNEAAEGNFSVFLPMVIR